MQTFDAYLRHMPSSSTGLSTLKPLHKLCNSEECHIDEQFDPALL